MDLSNLLLSETVYGSAPPSTDPMCIVYTVDANYVKPMGVAMTSILEHNTGGGIEFHVFSDTPPSADDAERFTRTMNRFGSRCVWHTIDPTAIYSLDIPAYRGSKAIYFRLVVLDYFYGIRPRVLYLDVDAFCIGSLREVYQTPLTEGKTIIAVKEVGLDPRPRGIDSDGYFNSGFMLIDTAVWRERRITECAFERIKTEPVHSDNDTLCLLHANTVEWVPLRYNTPANYAGNYPGNTVVVHFWKTGKPWEVHFCCLGQNNVWRECKERSAWADVDFYTQPHTYSEARVAAKIFWRQGQYIDAARWCMHYLAWKLLGIKYDGKE